MNVVNVGEHLKSATFTTYVHENKGSVNVVNVVRRFFALRARSMPNTKRSCLVTGDLP